MKKLLIYIFLFNLFLQNAYAQDSLGSRLATLFNSGDLVEFDKIANRAIKHFESTGKKDSLAFLLAYKSRSIEYQQGLLQAKNMINRSLNLLKNNNNTSATIKLKIYQEASHIFQGLNQFDSTEYYFTKIKSIISNNKVNSKSKISPKIVGVNYYNFASYYYFQNKFEEARINIKKALEIFEKEFGQKNNYYISSLDLLASIYFYESKIQKALENYEKSLALNDSLSNGSSFNNMVGHFNYAGVLDEIGDYRNAIKQINISLKIAKTLIKKGIIDKSYLISIYDQMANTYSNLNLKEKAIAIDKKAKILLSEFPDEYQPYFYSNMALNYLDLDSIENAKELMKLAWIDFNKFDKSNLLDYARLLNTEAQILEKDKNYGNAIDKYQRSIQIQDSLLDSPYLVTADCYSGLGNIYFIKKDYEKAIDYFDKALEITDSIYPHNHPNSFQIRTYLANTYAHKGEIFKAKLVFNELFVKSGIDTVTFKVIDWTKLPMSWAVPEAISKYLSLMEKTKSPSKSFIKKYLKLKTLYEVYLKKQLKYTNDITANYGIDKYLFNTFSNIIKYCFINKDLLHNADETIFDLVLKSKSFVSKLIMNDISIEKYSGIPDSIIAKEQKLKIQLHIASSHFFDKEVNQNQGDYFEKERKFVELNRYISKNYPKYYDYKYEYKFPSIVELQDKIDGETSILNYFISDSICLGIYISRRDIVIQKLNTSVEELDDLVEKMNYDIQNTLSNDWRNETNKLYKILLLPFKDQLFKKDNGELTQNFKKLIISPDGSLWNLDFELLFPEENPQAHMIIYSTSFDFNAKAQETYHKTDEIIGFIPTFSKSITVLDQLYSKELGSILKEEFNADVFYDSLATESILKQKSNDYSFLHIATHGIIDEQDPFSTHILLYPDSVNDGNLYLSEVFGLNIDNHLTVLSACSTSKGKYRKGIGKNCFSFAFRYAGSDNILTSSWAIDEFTSSLIIKKMYKHLSNGSDVATSLYLAKKEFLKDAVLDQKHPYYWAGLTVIGNPGLHSNVNLDLTKYIFIILLIVILILQIKKKLTI